MKAMKKMLLAIALVAMGPLGEVMSAPLISAELRSTSETMAQSRGIHFVKGKWTEILARARKENKLIFIDFYTQWCGPCYHMAQNIFTLSDVGDFYNSNFVCVKIDAEEGEGRELSQRYSVRSYPTYSFIDPFSGELLHRSGSRQTLEQFLFTGQSALIPKLRSTYLKTEFEKGNRDRSFLMDYIRYYNSIYDRKQVKVAFDELIRGGAKLTERDVWNVFVESIHQISPYLKEVSSEYEKFCELFGKTEVDAKFSQETQYGDVAEIEKLCNFENKSFNCELIRISNAIYRQHNYDEAISRIDALIGNPVIDQQLLMERLRFLVRVDRYAGSEIPQKWFYKCLEYLRYIAYNYSDRSDVQIHQEYAYALEQLLGRMKNKTEIPEGLKNDPKFGKIEYSLRPEGLKQKPQPRKK